MDGLSVVSHPRDGFEMIGSLLAAKTDSSSSCNVLISGRIYIRHFELDWFINESFEMNIIMSSEIYLPYGYKKRREAQHLCSLHFLRLLRIAHLVGKRATLKAPR